MHLGDSLELGTIMLQLNVEGLTKAKITLMEHILQKQKAITILFQGTHTTDHSHFEIPGLTLAAHTESGVHGISTFVKDSAKYSSSNPDGVTLEDWASASDVQLLYDPKQPDSFHIGRWNRPSNPDLTFTNLNGTSSQRIILDPILRSQHRQ